MHLTVRSLLLLFAVGALTIATHSQVQLDTTFNTTGKQFTDGGIGRAMVVQPDNKIIVIGSRSESAGSFGTVRYNADGSLDTSFGTGGVVITDFSATLNDTAFGLALQADGRIVVVGVTSWNIIGLGDFAMVRYNADGSLDNTFGNGGKVITNVQPMGEDIAKSIAIQTDGKLVVVGRTQGASPDYQVAVRYEANGTLDPTFGTGGIARTVVSSHYIWGESVAVQRDGKVLIGGGMQTVPAPPTATFSYTLTRLNPDGIPDTSFDGDGRRAIVFGIGGDSNIHIRSLGVQDDGRIVAAGWDSVLFRFNVDGSLDTSFDNDGIIRPVLRGGEPKALRLSRNGKITLVGTFSNDFAIGRYNSNGSPDTSFGANGNLFVDIDNGSQDVGASVAADSLGRILLGGSSNVRYAVARLVAPASSEDVSGRVTTNSGRPVSNGTVYISGAGGTVLMSRTNAFGYYRFFGLPSGVYTVTVKSKNLTFTPRTINVFDNIVDADIVADP